MGDKNLFRWGGVPPMGTEFMVQGQVYRFLKAVPHTTKAGNKTMILHWETFCASCGEPFVVTTGMHGIWGRRRCEKHKGKGKITDLHIGTGWGAGWEWLERIKGGDNGTST